MLLKNKYFIAFQEKKASYVKRTPVQDNPSFFTDLFV